MALISYKGHINSLIIQEKYSFMACSVYEHLSSYSKQSVCFISNLHHQFIERLEYRAIFQPSFNFYYFEIVRYVYTHVHACMSPNVTNLSVKMACEREKKTTVLTGLVGKAFINSGLFEPIKSTGIANSHEDLCHQL